MQREFSAGGVLVRRLRGRWMMAAIRPAGKPPGLWALPKGRIDAGASGEATALREVEEETTASGIVLPDTAKEKPQRGRVLAVGPGARDEDGEHIPLDLEEGDEIIFSKYGGTEIKVGVDEVLILRESDVLAKVVGDRAAV